MAIPCEPSSVISKNQGFPQLYRSFKSFVLGLGKSVEYQGFLGCDIMSRAQSRTFALLKASPFSLLRLGVFGFSSMAIGGQSCRLPATAEQAVSGTLENAIPCFADFCDRIAPNAHL